MRASDALGRYGEDLACRFLADAGYRIIDRNWRSSEPEVPGELDIVAVRGTTIAFCEVKTRRSDAFGSPSEAITPAKNARLRRLAAVWLRDHDHHVQWIRVDLIAVMRPISGPARIEHVQGIEM